MIDLFLQIWKKGAESIRSRNSWRLRPALDVRVCLHALWQHHSAMDYAALSTVSFEQRAAHPWILCMALRQHRYPILLGPFMGAIHCSDWILSRHPNATICTAILNGGPPPRGPPHSIFSGFV